LNAGRVEAGVIPAGETYRATAYSTVDRIDISIEDLRSKNRFVLNLVGSFQIPLLKLLPVAGVEYLPEDAAVVLKLGHEIRLDFLRTGSIAVAAH